MISIIIPVLNEEKNMKETLLQFCQYQEKEVIVVDGGSKDNTVNIAQSFDVKIVQRGHNRAQQMNEGAKEAKGDIYLFMHSDCRLEKDALKDIEQCMISGAVGGCLSQRIDSSKRIFRYIEKSGNFRARITKIFYGDQAIFVSKDVFKKLNGYEDVALFEDVLFSKRLRQMGKVCVLNKKVTTSPRRWQLQGVAKTTLINWFLTCGFTLGVSPKVLGRYYEDIR